MRKALLTDLGKILVDFRERLDYTREIIEAFGGNADACYELFPGSKEGVRGEQLYHALDTGALTTEDFHAALCRASGIDVSYKRFLNLWCRQIEVIPQMVEFYKQIQERFPIIVVSNGGFTAPDLLRVHGIKFHEVFVSNHRRVKKPNLFALVVNFLKENDFDPSLCPFVDDLEAYVSGARAYGLPSILFNATKQPVADLKSELAKFGIE